MISLIASGTPIPPFTGLCWSFRCRRNGGRMHRGRCIRGCGLSGEGGVSGARRVGTLTTAILFENVLKAMELRSFRPQPDRGALTKRWCRLIPIAGRCLKKVTITQYLADSGSL